MLLPHLYIGANIEQAVVLRVFKAENAAFIAGRRKQGCKGWKTLIRWRN